QVTSIALAIYPSNIIVYIVFKAQPFVKAKLSNHVGKPFCPGHFG
ncbi:MAG: hypothetical protein PWP25_1720, partial [Sphaerochaeta sp.]|nr:hypothetical protein [Sphaerochaeta sp.]